MHPDGSNSNSSMFEDITDDDDNDVGNNDPDSIRVKLLPTRSDNTDYDQKELNNYEAALSKIGFGKFHYLLLLICGFANSADAIEIICVSFILPAAECDLNLSTSDKGYLNAITFLGMMIGGYLWGALSDLWGRKYILISALFFNSLFAAFAGMSQSFHALLIFRLLSGVGIGGSIPIVWSYFTEFMPKNIRGRMMCCLATSWCVGNVIVVLLAFIILNHTHVDFNLFDSIKINNWRLFMIICSLPSAISAISIFFLPESPKYYLYNTKYKDAQEVLKYVYLFNNKVETTQAIDAKWRAFKFFEKLKHRPIITTNDCVTDRYRVNNNKNKSVIERFKYNFINVIHQTMLVFKAPYTLNTFLILYMVFSLMFGSYGLLMWLPELYKRMTIYGGTPCKPSHPLNMTLGLEDDPHKPCHIDTSVFVSSLLGALSNVPGNIFTIIFIDRIGRKVITVTSFLIAGISVFGISLITTQSQGVLLTTIFNGVTVLTYNAFGCTCTELYPTTLRSTALGVQYVAGRSGAILGNILFGLAIDVSCYIPLVTISFIMITSGLLGLKLPESNRVDIH